MFKHCFNIFRFVCVKSFFLFFQILFIFPSPFSLGEDINIVLIENFNFVSLNEYLTIIFVSRGRLSIIHLIVDKSKYRKSIVSPITRSAKRITPRIQLSPHLTGYGLQMINKPGRREFLTDL